VPVHPSALSLFPNCVTRPALADTAFLAACGCYMNLNLSGQITPSIDFAHDGVQHGFLRLPHSRNDSAWGAILIPIFQLKNGAGPTALITGGNHGDEYEGPIALFSLAVEAQIERIRGRVIVIPAMNYPAFCAATRVSPVDGHNLNRIFPGNPRGTVTEQIADYFTSTLLPLADFVLDIHSGGKTLDFVPLAAVHRLESQTQYDACFAAMRAIGAPYQLIMHSMGVAGLYDSQAEAMGKVFVTTELGGGGTTTPASVEIAERGVRNFLIHAGILEEEPTLSQQTPILLDSSVENSHVYSENAGLLRPLATLGEMVTKGQPLADVHEHSCTGTPPKRYHASRDGMLICRHLPSLIQPGDCMYVIAKVVQ